MFNKRHKNIITNQSEMKRLICIFAFVQWLVFFLLLYYSFFHFHSIKMPLSIIVFFGAYFVYLLLWHLINKKQWLKKYLFDLSSWITIFFITSFMVLTNQYNLVLFNLYLLPIICSAIVLRRVLLIFQMLFVAIILLIAGALKHEIWMLTQNSFSLIEFLVPLFFVIAVASLLSYEVHLTKEKLRKLSERDYLTNLFNLRAFYLYLTAEEKRAKRFGLSFSILMIDIDELKSYNDQYGHEVGDRIIQHVAKLIKEQVREIDVVARYGGDEFLVLLVETNKKNAALVANRIEEHLKQTFIPIDGSEEKATVSIGIACYPDDSEQIHKLITKADDDMYRRKTKAGNFPFNLC